MQTVSVDDYTAVLRSIIEPYAGSHSYGRLREVPGYFPNVLPNSTWWTVQYEDLAGSSFHLGMASIGGRWAFNREASINHSLIEEGVLPRSRLVLEPYEDALTHFTHALRSIYAVRVRDLRFATPDLAQRLFSDPTVNERLTDDELKSMARLVPR